MAEVSLPLLPFEEQLISANSPPVSTITWFEGDHTSAAQNLKKKAAAILASNLWLAGKIVKREGRAFLVHPETLKDDDELLNSHFAHLDDPTEIQQTTLKRDLPLENFAALCAPFLVQNRLGESLWSVTVLPCKESPDKRFAVIHSMSHIAGDGHTYYNIHNMLCSNCEVKKLNAERLFETEAMQKKVLGEKEYYLLCSGAFITGMIVGLLKTAILTPLKLAPDYEQRYVLVDEEKIGQLKSAVLSEAAATDADDNSKTVPFVSTNDILSSWYLNHGKCTYGFMPINFRNRLEGHTDSLAGNYENAIFYYPDDCVSPGLIRKSLIANPGDSFTLKRHITGETTSTPSLWDNISGNVYLATNWKSFSKDADIPGCREELHLPLFGQLSISPNNFGGCIIFRAAPGKTAVHLMGNAQVMSGLENAPFESDEKLH